jgi:hypothetical protein
MNGNIKVRNRGNVSGEIPALLAKPLIFVLLGCLRKSESVSSPTPLPTTLLRTWRLLRLLRRRELPLKVFCG